MSHKNTLSVIKKFMIATAFSTLLSSCASMSLEDTPESGNQNFNASTIKDKFESKLLNADSSIIRLNDRENAVSFSYALKTGRFPVLGDEPYLFIDWDGKDVFTQNFDKMKQDVLLRVGESAELTALLEKEEWNVADRKTWEKEIAKISAEVIESTSGLEKYRTTKYDALWFDRYKGIYSDRRSVRLNDLSEDMLNGTTNIEFDCEHMSALQGLLVQHIENTELPVVSGNDDYKSQQPYFYMVGDSSSSYGLSYLSTGHAFIASSSTGSIIEATVPVSGSEISTRYKESLLGGYSFTDLVNGRPFVLINDISVIRTYEVETDSGRGYRELLSESERKALIGLAESETQKYFNIVSDINENKAFQSLKEIMKVPFDDMTSDMRSELSDAINDEELNQMGENLKLQINKITVLWLDAYSGNRGDIDAYQKIYDGLSHVIESEGGEIVRKQPIFMYLEDIKEDIDSKIEYSENDYMSAVVTPQLHASV